MGMLLRRRKKVDTPVAKPVEPVADDKKTVKRSKSKKDEE